MVQQGKFANCHLHFTCLDHHDESFVVGLAPASLLCARDRFCAWCCCGNARYLEKPSNSSAVLTSSGRWKLCPSVKSSVVASPDRTHHLLVKDESTRPLNSAIMQIKVHVSVVIGIIPSTIVAFVCFLWL